MSHHRLELQIEKVHHNQTAVMLMMDKCIQIRDNTSRAVTSLDNMVLYFMKTKGSENDTSLMGLLHVSCHVFPFFFTMTDAYKKNLPTFFQLGELYESIRWPATLGFLTLLLLLCTVLVIGVARRSRCALIFFSVSGLFCIIFCWLLSGVYLASSVAAGDFCMRPHEFMCRQVGMVSQIEFFSYFNAFFLMNIFDDDLLQYGRSIRLT